MRTVTDNETNNVNNRRIDDHEKMGRVRETIN